MKQLWYLSFVDVSGEQDVFKGGCVVRGDNMAEAIVEAWRRGINPGGEVMGVLVDPEKLELPLNRLMSREELESFGPVVRYGDANIQKIGDN